MTETTSLFADIAKLIQGLPPSRVTEGELDDLAMRLRYCQQLSVEVKDIIDHLSETIAAKMEQDSSLVAGLGTVQRKPKTSSTWIDDSSRERMMEDAISAIIQRVAVDPATGEMHRPLANTAREVWRLTQDAFSFTADPKTAFRKVLGLAPDEYRSKRVTGYTVVITEGEDDVAK